MLSFHINLRPPSCSFFQGYRRKPCIRVHLISVHACHRIAHLTLLDLITLTLLLQGIEQTYSCLEPTAGVLTSICVCGRSLVTSTRKFLYYGYFRTSAVERISQRRLQNDVKGQDPGARPYYRRCVWKRKKEARILSEERAPPQTGTRLGLCGALDSKGRQTLVY